MDTAAVEAPSQEELLIARQNILTHVVPNDSIPSELKDLLVQVAVQVRSPLNSPDVHKLYFDRHTRSVRFAASGERPGKSCWSAVGMVIHEDGSLHGGRKVDNTPKGLQDAYKILGLSGLVLAA